jgi:hypothetical protein
VAVAVAALNLAVAAVDQQFRPLVARDLTPAGRRIGLAIEDFGRTLRALALDGPVFLVGHRVLISFRTRVLLREASGLPHTYLRRGLETMSGYFRISA